MKSMNREGFRYLESPETKTFLVGSFPPILHPTTPPHTVILGTMPSTTSHACCQYYGHPSNVFWWVVGEALGFRRGGPFPSKPAKDILEGLHQCEDTPELGYQDQVEALTAAGYVLWDVVRSCRIRNSEDASIKDKEPNNIRGLLDAVPSIKRIVFSGKASAKLFLGMNKAWLNEGSWRLGGGSHTEEVFGKLLKRKHEEQLLLMFSAEEGVELSVPVSVSPAAAGVRFQGKREEWLRVVFNQTYNTC